MPLALVHSLLLHQSFYGNSAFVRDNHWSLTDLASAVDIFKKVMTKTQSVDGVKRLMAQVYYDHCTDVADARVVWAIVNVLVEMATKEDQMVCSLLYMESNC